MSIGCAISAFEGGRSNGNESTEEMDGIGSGVSALEGGRSSCVGVASCVVIEVRD